MLEIYNILFGIHIYFFLIRGKNRKLIKIYLKILID